MTLYQLFDLTSYIAGKFPQGAAFTPTRFNLLLQQVQSEYYDKCWRELVAASVNDTMYDKVLSTTPLLPFKKTATLTIATDGTATLPGDFADYITLYSVSDNDPMAGVGVIRFRKIDIVNDELFNRRRGSVFTRAGVQPFAKITDGGVTVVPNDIATTELDYLRTPATPYMDYCTYTDNPSAVLFMPTGSAVHADDAQILCLYSTAGALLYQGVLKDAPLTSQTVELEWAPKDQWEFVYLILEKIGINLSAAQVTQYAMAKEGK